MICNGVCTPREGFQFNSGLAKVAVRFFVRHFFVNLKCMLLKEVSALNRHLRQAAARYAQFKTTAL